jgi:hypothetical protein
MQAQNFPSTEALTPSTRWDRLWQTSLIVAVALAAVLWLIS